MNATKTFIQEEAFVIYDRCAPGFIFVIPYGGLFTVHLDNCSGFDVGQRTAPRTAYPFMRAREAGQCYWQTPHSIHNEILFVEVNSSG